MATCTALAHCGLKKHGSKTGAVGDLPRSARVKPDCKKDDVHKLSFELKHQALKAKCKQSMTTDHMARTLNTFVFICHRLRLSLPPCLPLGGPEENAQSTARGFSSICLPSRLSIAA